MESMSRTGPQFNDPYDEPEAHSHNSHFAAGIGGASFDIPAWDASDTVMGELPHTQPPLYPATESSPDLSYGLHETYQLTKGALDFGSAFVDPNVLLRYPPLTNEVAARVPSALDGLGDPADFDMMDQNEAGMLSECFQELSGYADGITREIRTHGTLDDVGAGPHSSRLSIQQRDALKAWIDSHAGWPYPTGLERKQLAIDNGLLESQVRTFFTNYRRRRMDKTIDIDAGIPENSLIARPRSPETHDGDNVSLSSSCWGATPASVISDEDDGHYSRLSDFEGDRLQWYLAGLPEGDVLRFLMDTPVSSPVMTPIITPSPSVEGRIPMETLPSGCKPTTPASAPPSVGGSAYSRPGSVYSRAGSAYTARSSVSNKSRRGRRAYGKSPESPDPSSDSKGKAHKCPHCRKRFTRAYTLKRHVDSIHLTNTVWICQTLPNASRDTHRCLTCERPPEHCAHGMLECWARPEDERTFIRKDLLKQHLDLVHDFTKERTRRGRISNDLLSKLQRDISMPEAPPIPVTPIAEVLGTPQPPGETSEDVDTAEPEAGDDDYFGDLITGSQAFMEDDDMMAELEAMMDSATEVGTDVDMDKAMSVHGQTSLAASSSPSSNSSRTTSDDDDDDGDRSALAERCEAQETLAVARERIADLEACIAARTRMLSSLPFSYDAAAADSRRVTLARSIVSMQDEVSMLRRVLCG